MVVSSPLQDRAVPKLRNTMMHMVAISDAGQVPAQRWGASFVGLQ